MRNLLILFFAFALASANLSFGRNPNRLPLNTPYFSTRFAGAASCIWSLEVRTPGQLPMSEVQNKPCFSVWDTQNMRWSYILDFGGAYTQTWVYPDRGYILLPTGECFKFGYYNWDLSTTIGQNMAVKVDEEGPIDIYRGVNYDAGNGNSPVWGENLVDTRTNHTVQESWSQPIRRPRNPDGSCPFLPAQIFGTIIYTKFLTLSDLPASGDGSLNSYFVLPAICNDNSPIYEDGYCWY